MAAIKLIVGAVLVIAGTSLHLKAGKQSAFVGYFMSGAVFFAGLSLIFSG